MTDSLQLDYAWQRPEAIHGEELRATWASLRVISGSECLTRILDRTARSVREEIYVPLYPLAEWIAENWWSLLYEPEIPQLREKRGFRTRHDLALVGDGLAMPRVEIVPFGETVRIEWEQKSHPYQQIDFLSRGRTLVRTQDVRDGLYAFVQGVCERLEQSGLRGTWLQQSWQTVKQSMQDPEETAFCRAAAQMGQDPYALKETEAEELLQASRILPSSLLHEFLQLAPEKGFADRAQEMGRDLEWIEGNRDSWEDLSRLRAEAGQPEDRARPWEQGYRMARAVRSSLGCNGNVPGTLEQLLAWLGGSMQSLRLRERSGGDLPGLTALVSENEKGCPGFVLSERKRPENRAFAFCRGLGEYFFHPGSASLVNTANTDRQKRNRAFAAELMAPAERIREHLSGWEATPEEIDEIACSLGVSSYVVLHQMENHDLAVTRKMEV